MFDHGSFTAERARALLEAQLRDNSNESYLEQEITTPEKVTSKKSTVPRFPIAYEYGRADKSSKIADGDRVVIYTSELDSIAYACEIAGAAESITHISKAEFDTLKPGGAMNKLSMKCVRQVLTDMALDFNVIVSGSGTAADNTLVDVVALPAGDEFNSTTAAKTYEEYLREAVRDTGGSSLCICENVWHALLANPDLAENGLNQHTMTDDELVAWHRARGITTIYILKNQAQQQDPRQGFSKDYIHADVVAVGQLEAIQRIVFRDIRNRTARDELADTDYYIADAVYDFVVGFAPVVRAFTNTMA